MNQSTKKEIQKKSSGILLFYSLSAKKTSRHPFFYLYIRFYSFRYIYCIYSELWLDARSLLDRLGFVMTSKTTRLRFFFRGGWSLVRGSQQKDDGWVRTKQVNAKKVSRIQGSRNLTRVFAGLHLDRFPSTFLHRVRPSKSRREKNVATHEKQKEKVVLDETRHTMRTFDEEEAVG